MVLHDCFHRGSSLISNSVSVLDLVLQELAASLGNALLITGQTCGSSAVALYAGNCDCLNLIPASSLSSLNSSLAAHCSSILVAGAYEGQNLRCIDVGINCNDRCGLASDQGLNEVSLQRSDNECIVCAGVQVGLDHILLLVVSGLGGSALNLNLYVRVVLGVSLSASLNVAPVLGSSRLQDNVNRATGSGASVIAAILLGVVSRGRRTAAASCKACNHSASHQHSK